MDIKQIECKNVDWINLTYDSVTGSCKHGNGFTGSV